MMIQKKMKARIAVVVLLLISTSAEGGTCDFRKWTSRDFWKTATVPDVRTCISAGADLEARSDGKMRVTPLYWAARGNPNPDVIKTLLESGSDVEARGKHGFTPLYAAAGHNGSVEVLETLLEAGASKKVLNKWKYRLLHMAAASNPNPEVVRFLISTGADLEAKAERKYTPLHRAAMHNRNPKIVQVLLDAGADLEAKDDRPWLETTDEWRRPLHLAAAYNENPAIIETLLQAGSGLEVRSRWERTPLHLAAESNRNPDVIQYLLAVGADLEARDGYRSTPLHFAAFNQSPAIAQTLIEAGANQAAWDKKKRTPLQAATKHHGQSHPEVRSMLRVAWNRQSESQKRAERERRKANSGPGFLGAAIGIAGGAAIAAAGGGTEEAIEAGSVFAEGMISGQSPAGSFGGYSSTPTGPAGASGAIDTALRNLEGSCGERYRSGFSAQDHYRFYCLDAFSRYCALKKGPNKQHLDALKHDFAVLQSQGVESRCPYFEVLGGPGYSEVSSSIDRENKRREQQAKQQEEARQAAQREKRRIAAKNAEVLNSNCSCISIEDDGEYVCMDGFVSDTPLCDIRR